MGWKAVVVCWEVGMVISIRSSWPVPVGMVLMVPETVVVA